MKTILIDTLSSSLFQKVLITWALECINRAQSDYHFELVSDLCFDYPKIYLAFFDGDFKLFSDRMDDFRKEHKHEYVFLVFNYLSNAELEKMNKYHFFCFIQKSSIVGHPLGYEGSLLLNSLLDAARRLSLAKGSKRLDISNELKKIQELLASNNQHFSEACGYLYSLMRTTP